MILFSWEIRYFGRTKCYIRYSEKDMIILRISEDEMSRKQNSFFAEIRERPLVQGFNRWEKIGEFKQLIDAILHSDLMAGQKGYFVERPFYVNRGLKLL